TTTTTRFSASPTTCIRFSTTTPSLRTTSTTLVSVAGTDWNFYPQDVTSTGVAFPPLRPYGSAGLHVDYDAGDEIDGSINGLYTLGTDSPGTTEPLMGMIDAVGLHLDGIYETRDPSDPNYCRWRVALDARPFKPLR